MKIFHFVERVGRKVIRTGTVPAPTMDGFPKMDPGSLIELVDKPCAASLPAYWDANNRSAVALPIQPSPAYDFDYGQLKWIPDGQRLWLDVRAERDRRISASDWVMLPDVTMSSDRKASWATYRQALRDITGQPDPTKISWPVAPA